MCTWQGTRGIVRAHLDSTGLDLTGAHHLHIDLSEVTQTRIDSGALRLQTRKGVLVLELPSRVETWARNISNPRSRIEKLGIKQGARVVLAGNLDPLLKDELVSVGCTVLQRASKSSVDAVFLTVEKPDQLLSLPRYRALLVSDGALWVIRRKGKDAQVTESQVRAGAKDAGLVDIKVVAYSPTHSAEKLVIPRAERD